MKVLIIPENFPTDENPVAGIFIKDQIKALAPFSEITVFNSNPWYRGKYENIEGVQFYDFHLYANKPPTIFKLPAYAWWEVQSFTVAKKIPKPDIIHLHGASLRGKWVQKLAAFWDIPFVITEHTGPWSAIANRPRIFKRAKQTLENAAAILPVSQHLKQEMIDSGIDAKRWEVFGNPVDTEFFELRKSPLTISKNILFLGRLDPFKGGLPTIKAFDQAKHKLPNYTLTIAGTGEEAQEIEDYIAQNQLQNRVIFLNEFISRHDMRQLFHESSFLVFPSEFESFGLVAAEAMATGLPVVITNQTGPKDFTNSKTAIPVSPLSIDEIADGMVKIANQIEQYSASEIRAFITAKFGLETYGRQLISLYEDLIQQ